MISEPTVAAFIPARSQSKRARHKNIRLLAGHPMLAYTISAAQKSGVFAAIFVSTDDALYADVARHYGAEVLALRPAEIAGDLSPDIAWVRHLLQGLDATGRAFDCFSILRPTNPYRTPETIRRAWGAFTSQQGLDSLRAVEPCKQHPGKMWVVRGERMVPLLPLSPAEQPWHSSQLQALPQVYVQNASLEIAWSRVVRDGGNIAGNVIMPFLTEGYEGVDVNSEDDWAVAERLAATRPELIGGISKPPFPVDRLPQEARRSA